MEIYEALMGKRTVRKFKNEPVKKEDVEKLIEVARTSQSSANLQSLRYAVVTAEEKRRELFPHLKYAGYIPSWNPEFLQTATAFVVIVNDNSVRSAEKTECDAGIAIERIALLAHGLGLGSCTLGSANKTKVKEILGLSDDYSVMYVIAVGYPAQEGEVFTDDETVKYYFDDNGDCHVPKRSMDKVLLKYE